MAARGLRARQSALLPSSRGHSVRGDARPLVPDASIEVFAHIVAEAFEGTRETGREHGFLAYASSEPGLPLTAEPMSVGHEADIRWAWSEPGATVALSFHTHPGADSLCAPSGIDLLGALVRGDHVLYVLTMDGRLSGWRFRPGSRHARGVDDAMRALDQARKLDGAFVAFLYEAFEALRRELVEPVYAARLTLADGGCRFEPASPGAGFFSRAER